MNKSYTVRPDGPGGYVVIDMKTGAFVNRFHVPGQLVNGPIVSSDSCTIVTKANNLQMGYVVRLPSGQLINRFTA
jgi:hypothetical protein